MFADLWWVAVLIGLAFLGLVAGCGASQMSHFPGMDEQHDASEEE